MKIVSFDAATHAYDGGKLVSVTTVIKAAGLMGPMPDDPFYMQRGTAVHLVCQLHDEGDLDLNTVDPKIAGYFEGYIKFLLEHGYHDWDTIEKPIGNGQYAGTPDRIVTKRPRSVWDIKTGDHMPWHAIQSAAYVNLLEDPFSYSRYGLYLTDDGKYSIKEFPKAEYVSDLNAFLSALNIYNWRRNHGC